MRTLQAIPAAFCVAVIALIVCLPQVRAQTMASSEEAERWADETLAQLTLEEKVGQIICVDIVGGYITADDPRLQRWIELARDHHIGGFVFYGGTPRDVAHLLNRLQKEAKLPILMSADFEGGPGQQVAGATEFPANMAFAAAGNEELMYEAACIGAIEGRAMGIHLTYTPVVDVSLRPDNPCESVRSFGGDIDLLGRLVRAYVKGYSEHGMITTAKHFPGRGDIEVLPEFPDFRYIDKSAEQVETNEFRAFKHAIDAGVVFVMSEHIAVPSAADGSLLPASVEGKLATGWLRGKLGFEGILTTDDLWYDHVVARFGGVEVGLLALEAGHDILLKPKDPAAMIEGVVAAVRSGRIPEERIDRSVRKLLYWKARLNLHKERFVDEEKVDSLVGTPAHLAVAQKVADRSLTLLTNDGVLPLSADRLARIVNIAVQKIDGDTAPARLDGELKAAFPGTVSFTLRPDSNPAVYNEIRNSVVDADLVVFSLFVQRSRQADSAPFRENDLALMREIIAAKPKAVIAISYGNPHLIRKIAEVPVFLVGYGEGGWYGNQAVYFQSFIRLLKGEIKPVGRLPVNVSEDYPTGSGMSY